MKKILIVLSLLFTIPVIASGAETFSANTWEVGFSTNSYDTTLEPFIGYFINDNLEGIFHFGMQRTNLEADTVTVDDKSTYIELGVQYNIPTSSLLVPVFGFNIEYVDSEETVSSNGSVVSKDGVSGIVYGVNLGARFMVTNRSSITPMVSLGLGSLDYTSSGQTTSADFNGFSFDLAYSLFF